MKVSEVSSLYTLVGIISKNEFYMCNSKSLPYSWKGFFMYVTKMNDTLDCDWIIGETRRGGLLKDKEKIKQCT